MNSKSAQFKHMRFFATKADIEPGIRLFESRHSVTYVATGVYNAADIPTFASALDIPHLGFSPEELSAGLFRYIVLSCGAHHNVDIIKLDAGGMRYDVNPGDNPHAFLVQFGGLLPNGKLRGGRCYFNSTEPAIHALCLEFAACITGGFIQVRDPLKYPWQLGPEAFEMLKQGRTLETAYNYPVALSQDDIPKRNR